MHLANKLLTGHQQHLNLGCIEALNHAAMQGAETSIYLASSPAVDGITAKYWVDCRPKSSNRESYDVAVAARLWEVSQELTGAECSLARSEQVATLAGQD